LPSNTSTLADVALWHEHDIYAFFDRAGHRPRCGGGARFCLGTADRLIDRLVAYPEHIFANLELSGGLVDPQRVLPALTQAGMSREDACAVVQRQTMAAWQGGAGFADRLKADSGITRYLSLAEIDGSFDTAGHLKHVDTIFRRVFGDD
jgi:adenylosuccinate lyase